MPWIILTIGNLICHLILIILIIVCLVQSSAILGQDLQVQGNTVGNVFVDVFVGTLAHAGALLITVFLAFALPPALLFVALEAYLFVVVWSYRFQPEI